MDTEYDVDFVRSHASKSDNIRESYYINIPNKSHYITNDSKTKFRLVNPKCFAAQHSKQLSYFVRLYYHYQHVKLLGGQCYFYTLTYNDASLPHFMGVRCFNHDHIQTFFRSSGFDKKLLRYYGLRLQYFVSCELGDGKGSRGIEGNPHYHVIFFLLPDKRYKQNYLSPSTFQELVRNYWCGSDYRFKIPQDFKYGIAMPGDDLGVVKDSAALGYCAKYVIKDTVYHKLVGRLCFEAKRYIYERLTNMRMARKLYEKYARKDFLPIDNPDVQPIIDRLFERLFKKDIFRLYVPRVRVSQGVGLYAVDHVNSDGVTINMPDKKKGFIQVVLPMYVYRKMYYDVVKDFNNNNKYVLNNRGIELRVSRLSKDCDRLFNEVSSLVDFYGKDRSVYTDDVISRYCLYDRVYRDRLCPTSSLPLSPVDDYALFCCSEYYRTNYTDDIESAVKMAGLRSELPTYDNHPHFKPMLNLFKDLDFMLTEHYFCQSKDAEQRFIDNKRVKSHQSKEKFNKYLSSISL